MGEEYNTNLPDHSVLNRGPCAGQDCALVMAAQLEGGAAQRYGPLISNMPAIAKSPRQV